MAISKLIENLASAAGRVPPEVEILALRQHTLDDMHQRAKRFLAGTEEAFQIPAGRSNLVRGRDQTVIQLALGARAVIYHASGAMKLVAGLSPMESLFKRAEERDRLMRAVDMAAARLGLNGWVGAGESVRFERLWQIKAAAADRRKTVDPVLCRIVGAYRHFVRELPVWGAASVALKLAGEGVLDFLSIQLRTPSGETIERAKVTPPEVAARQIAVHLEGLMGKSNLNLDESAKPQWVRFGYLSLSKRKPQRVLAPVYMAAISIEGQPESQAYLITTSATERAYLPLGQVAAEARPAPMRRAFQAAAGASDR